MRVLALDIGERRIGLAVSDELGLAAHGLPTLIRTKPSEDFKHLKNLVSEYSAQRIIAGLPLNLKGEIGPQARIVLDFIENLKKRVPDTPVVTWDERMTTQAAERVLLEADMSRSKRRKKIDQLAAVLILQGYLDWASSKDGGIGHIDV